MRIAILCWLAAALAVPVLVAACGGGPAGGDPDGDRETADRETGTDADQETADRELETEGDPDSDREERADADPLPDGDPAEAEAGDATDGDIDGGGDEEGLTDGDTEEDGDGEGPIDGDTGSDDEEDGEEDGGVALDRLPPLDLLGAVWEYTYTYGSRYYQTVTADRLYTDAAGRRGVVHWLSMSMVGMEISYLHGDGVLAYDQVISNGLLTDYDPPMTLLKAPLAVGDRWVETFGVTGYYGGQATRTVEVTGVERLTVEAGSFDCVVLHVVHDGPPMSYECDEWWSAEVGLVGSSLYNDYQLLSFTPP